MGKKYIVILFLLIPLLSTAQKIKLSNSAKNTVRQIAEENLLQGDAVGFSGTPGPQYLLYKNLKAQTTKKQIRSLLKHPNTTVKCYAFWSIVDDGDKKEIFNIIKQNMFDENPVETQFGCVVNTKMVGDIFLSEGYREYEPILDSMQTHELDSLLLYSNNKVMARDFVLNRLKPIPQYYNRLKELAETENNGEAVVKLSEYKKEDDYKVIYNYYKSINPDNSDDLYFFYKAVANLPNPIFFPILESQLNKTFSETSHNDIWGEVYLAIAAYKNAEAANLLRKVFTSIEHDNMMPNHSFYITSAIMEHKYVLYEPVLWEIMEKYPKSVDIEPYLYLFKLDKRKAYFFTRKYLGIRSSRTINNINYSPDDFIAAATVHDLMLYVLYKNEPDEALQYIKSHMQISQSGLGTYFRVMKEIKSPEFKEVLFKRLETEDDSYYIKRIVSILKSYKDDTVNEKIYLMRKINPNLKFEDLKEFDDND